MAHPLPCIAINTTLNFRSHYDYLVYNGDLMGHNH